MNNLEEGLGKYAYINLAQVKDYLSISSNTQDARLSNIIHYATGVIEHYIGQEVLANDYVETFDGGVSSVFVNRLPLSAVYQVTEFNGSKHVVLTDPQVDGSPIGNSPGTALVSVGTVELSSRVKKFGSSSAKLSNTSYIYSNSLSPDLRFGEGDFTIEMFVRTDSALQNVSIFTMEQNASNSVDFKLANAHGLALTTNTAGIASTILGANTLVESQLYVPRHWNHVAVTRDTVSERVYLHLNGTTIANTFVATTDMTYSSSLSIGKTFAGYIDEIRVSTAARYVSDFQPPSNRFRPDESTVLLIHFDETYQQANIQDAHSAPQGYNFSTTTGEITKDTGAGSTLRTYRSMQKSYPALSITGPAAFAPYPKGVKVNYRAGYEVGKVPYDLQIATLDYIKTIYKQDQEKRSFSFEGERGDSFELSGNFPPHVRRVLDLYRIIK